MLFEDVKLLNEKNRDPNEESMIPSEKSFNRLSNANDERIRDASGKILKVLQSIKNDFPSIKKNDLYDENGKLKPTARKEISEIKKATFDGEYGTDPIKSKVIKDSMLKTKTINLYKNPSNQNVSERMEKADRNDKAAKGVNLKNRNRLETFNEKLKSKKDFNFYTIVPNGLFVPGVNRNPKGSKGIDGIGCYDGKIYFIENKAANYKNVTGELEFFKSNSVASNAIPVINYSPSPSSRNEYLNKEKTQWENAKPEIKNTYFAGDNVFLKTEISKEISRILNIKEPSNKEEIENIDKYINDNIKKIKIKNITERTNAVKNSIKENQININNDMQSVVKNKNTQLKCLNRELEILDLLVNLKRNKNTMNSSNSSKAHFIDRKSFNNFITDPKNNFFNLLDGSSNKGALEFRHDANDIIRKKIIINLLEYITERKVKIADNPKFKEFRNDIANETSSNEKNDISNEVASVRTVLKKIRKKIR